MSATKKRNTTIDLLRVIAIITLVIEHTIGSDSKGGMQIEYPSFMRHIYLYTNYYGIPLFSAISGYVYAMRPAISFKDHFISKFKRLMQPALSVGIIYFLIQYITPNTNVQRELSDIWEIFIYPYTYFWFLPSLFLTMLLQYGIDKFKLNNSLTRSLIILAIALLCKVGINNGIIEGTPNFFSYQGAIGIFVFFNLGYIIFKYGKNIPKVAYTIIGIISIVFSVVLLENTWLNNMGNRDYLLYNCVSPILICGLLLFLLKITIPTKYLHKAANYTMGIYLFHGFGTSGGRIMLRMLSVENEMIILVVSSILAILISVIGVLIIRKTSFTASILLGEKRHKS